MSLADNTCEPCRGGIPPMDRETAEKLLGDVPGWELSADGTRITRKFGFADFMEALDFVRWVGRTAQDAEHHPEICFGWGFATVAFYSRKIGGLHENDFVLAARVNRLFEENRLLED